MTQQKNEEKNPQGKDKPMQGEIPDAELDKISGADGNWGAALTVRPVPNTTTKKPTLGISAEDNWETS